LNGVVLEFRLGHSNKGHNDKIALLP